LVALAALAAAGPPPSPAAAFRFLSEGGMLLCA
jgi:hypothetical protein